MNIVVCIKQVPNTTKVEVDEHTGVLKREGVDSKMNPYDLYALETALKLKEEKDAFITVVSMGPVQAQAVIKEAFMMGVDEGVLLSDKKFAGSDVLATAYTLSQGIRKVHKPDLIICGKQTTDGDTAQVGPEMAEYLGLPHVSNVKKIIAVNSNSIIVELDMQETLEVAEIEFPCLISVEKGINVPRLPSFVKKLASENKEINVYSLQDFEDTDEKKYGLNGSPTQVERIFPPTVNTKRELWNGNSDELTEKFFSKLKDLKFI